MRFCSFVLPLTLIVLAGQTLAHASTITESWSVSGSGISGSGTITLATTGTPGVDDITAITGSFSTTNGGGFSGEITGLNPGSYSNTAPTTDPPGTFDNLFYPSASAQDCTGYATGSENVLDNCGVDFLVTGGYEANIYGDQGGANGYDLTDGLENSVPIDNAVAVSFTLSPEPPALLLLATGLLGLAVIRLLMRRILMRA